MSDLRRRGYSGVCRAGDLRQHISMLVFAEEVRVSHKSVKKECQGGVSRKSVLQECQVRASYKSYKSVK